MQVRVVLTTGVWSPSQNPTDRQQAVRCVRVRVFLCVHLRVLRKIQVLRACGVRW
jgi:hypothetical protein